MYFCSRKTGLNRVWSHCELKVEPHLQKRRKRFSNNNLCVQGYGRIESVLHATRVLGPSPYHTPMSSDKSSYFSMCEFPPAGVRTIWNLPSLTQQARTNHLGSINASHMHSRRDSSWPNSTITSVWCMIWSNMHILVDKLNFLCTPLWRADRSDRPRRSSWKSLTMSNDLFPDARASVVAMAWML